MFADDLIIGEREAAFDEKARFNVPAFTNYEVDETMMFFYNIENDCVEMYSYSKIQELILKVANSKSIDYVLEHIDLIPRVKKMLENSLFMSKVNCGGRVVLSMDAIARYGFVPGTTIYLKGKVDHLEIYPNKETYDRMLEKCKLKKAGLK